MGWLVIGQNSEGKQQIDLAEATQNLNQFRRPN